MKTLVMIIHGKDIFISRRDDYDQQEQLQKLKFK